jgi:uncharacterized membrane protein/nitrite reductase/ring-hydroxylating ferredoxin subunit
MKSKAHIKGHPLHPLLVAFPIAFFTGTLLSDVTALITSKPMYREIASYLELAGVVFALLAAVPGIIDYFSVVPPESSAKKRATKHGLINVIVVFIFTIAFFLRKNPDVSFMMILGLEIAGVILLTISGWLGGTLVYRNQIGVDHRYADAGKWKEEQIGEDDSMEIKGLSELKRDQMKLVHFKGKRIVIGHTESGFVAFDDRCSHRGASLADGVLICGTVQCPWHGSQFDVRTGQIKAGPAKENIRTFIIENRDNKFYLKVD